MPELTQAYLVAKYDPNGALQWAISLGRTFLANASIDILDLTIDEGMGRFAIVGVYNGQMDIDPGPGTVVMQPSTFSSCYKSFVALYDMEGTYLSHMTLGTTCNEQVEIESAAFTPDHELVIGGTYFGTPDMDPVGTTTLPFGEDPWVARYSIPFSLDWVVPVNAQTGRTYGVAVSPTGQVAIVGSARGTSVDFDPGPGQSQTNLTSNESAFGALYSASGEFIWAHRLAAGSGQSTGLEVGFDEVGDLFFQGKVSYTSTSPFDLDPGPGIANFNKMPESCCNRFIQKLSNNGVYLWARMAWSSELSVSSEANRIALLDDVIVVGGDVNYNYAYRTFQAPGAVWTPLPECDGFGSRHYLAGLDRNTGELAWVLHDTIYCDSGPYSEFLGLDVAAGGAIALFGYFNMIMDGSMGLGEDIISGGNVVFISRFNAGDITTAVSNVPAAGAVSGLHVVSTTLTDMGGRMVRPVLPGTLQPADLHGLPPGIYLVTERLSDGTLRTRRSAWME